MVPCLINERKYTYGQRAENIVRNLLKWRDVETQNAHSRGL